MSYTCWHCKGTHEHSSQGRKCFESGVRPVANPPKAEPKELELTSESDVSFESVGVTEEPYRSEPGHNLFVRTGPRIEAWNEASATASGYCSCGHWEKFGLANKTSVVLAWNLHLEQWREWPE
jgi:hypothetical protein